MCLTRSEDCRCRGGARPLRTRRPRLASRPDPGPTPGSGGLRTQVFRVGDAESVRRATDRPTHLPRQPCDWRAVARTAQRPDPILGGQPPTVFPHVGDMAGSGPARGRRNPDSPIWSIRQAPSRPTVRLLWGGQDQTRHDQMLLRGKHTAKSRNGSRTREYRQRHGGASSMPAQVSGGGHQRQRFRQRAVDISGDG